MANPVNLHEFKSDFNSLVKETADFFGIREVFIEKDYWITLVLKRLADSEYSGSVVFKGGTSLSKGYKFINRFSEYVDIAIINASGMTGNQVKTLIRNVEKTISVDLTEVDTPGVTSKGPQFGKTVFTYPVSGDTKLNQEVSNKLIIECKSYFASKDFINDISELINHDRTAFDQPPGWGQKTISQSPLINGFDTLWNSIKTTYTRELSNLAFSEIPNKKDVAVFFKQVINKLSKITI